MFHLSWFRALCFVLVGASSIQASDFDLESLQDEIYTTIEAVKPAVVSISRRGSMFSGVIVSNEGHVLSAGHAVRPGQRYRVLLPDGRQLNAIGKGSNPQSDCALLKITDPVDDLPFARMGDSASLVRNQPCLSIAFPGGQGVRGAPFVRFGRVVSTGGNRSMLQSTALMEPGDSGGPLFDLQGRVIGIHSRIGRSMSRNFEVPIDTFKTYWNELNREKSFTQSGPPIPKLGIRGEEQSDGEGIKVVEVVDDSLAAKHGIETNDVIESVYGNTTPSIQDLRRALVAARDEDANEIVVEVRREGKVVVLSMPFDVDRDIAPEVALPKYDDQEFSKPRAIAQLSDLPQELSDLESELDDACVEISSLLPDGKSIRIVGTLIRETQFIVSKSSMVMKEPTVIQGETEVGLEIIARDRDNDLILLKAPNENTAGIALDLEATQTPSIGSFLITPDASGPGIVSVISSQSFASRKQQSRGFLGVTPANYKDNGGAVLQQVTKDGAAERAGLQVGDIVTRLNETVITSHRDMRRFLGTVDPNAIVVATILRGEEQLEKSIRLGTYPTSSNHAADQMRKSGRRDGFEKVISHDADLKPDHCGGPLFDLNGNFVGLNIARNSRVRSYAIPPALVKALIEGN